MTLFEYYGELSPYERAKLTSTPSMLFNFAAAAFKFALGLSSSVAALCISGLYSFFCGASKRIYFRGMTASMGDESRECGYYLLIGVVLTVSSAVYCIYMYFWSEGASGSPGAYATAAACGIALFELVASVSGLVRARRDGDLLMEGLRFVNLAAAFAAIVTAATAVCASVGFEDPRFPVYGGRFGVIMGGVSVLTGIYMIVKGLCLVRRYAARERVRIIER